MILLALILVIPQNVYAYEDFYDDFENEVEVIPHEVTYPYPITGFNINNHDKHGIEFILEVVKDEDIHLDINYTNVDQKDMKTLNLGESGKFQVEIPFDEDSDYNIELILTGEEGTLITVMASNLTADGRFLSNEINELSLFTVTGNFQMDRFTIMSYEDEPNDTMAQATSLPLATNYYGWISSSTDFDYYKITLNSKMKINISLTYACGFCDYWLKLYDASGNFIAESVSGGSKLISNRTLSAGTYYVLVHSVLGYYSATQSYTVSWNASQAWPAANTTSANITSHFGMRTHPVTGVQKMHNGMDISRGINDPILAAFDGTISAGYDATELGNYIIISSNVSGQTVYTRYYHLRDSVTSLNGTTIKAGQQIGIMGTTGNSTGIHLHFETRHGGTSTSYAVDPMTNLFIGW